MAEETKPGAAQNKLGELFVDFTSKGLGSLVKGLNTVSGTFLLTKNAAQQAIKPIMEMSKQAAQGVTMLDKASSITGMSLKELQEVELFSKLNNIDFQSYLGQIKNFQQNLLDIKMGQGNVKGLALLGLDPRNMDYKKPLDALSQIKERVQQVDEATGAMALRQLGLSEELLYTWKQENTDLSKNLRLTGQQMVNLKQQQENINSLNTAWGQFQNQLISNQKWINTLLKATQDWLESSHPYLTDMTNFLNAAARGELDKYTASWGEKIGDIISMQWKLGRESLKLNGNELNNPEVLKKYLKALEKQQAEEKRLRDNYDKAHNIDRNKSITKRTWDETAEKLHTYRDEIDVQETRIKGSTNLSNSEKNQSMGNSSSKNSNYLMPPTPLTNVSATNTRNIEINVAPNITINNPNQSGESIADEITKELNTIQYQNLYGI